MPCHRAAASRGVARLRPRLVGVAAAFFLVCFGALAVAASGAMQYEGIAGNDAHRDWLDSIVDRCVMYKAGHEQGYSENLGLDAEFVGTASKYFGGTMMEARRLLMPDDGEGGDAGEDDEAEESSDGE